MHRIVSLIPSATEIVCALGLGEHLVGRSHECDYPPEVRRLPVCTAPKLNIHGSSAAIDRQVKALLKDVLSVYRVDTDLLRQLEPTAIITQAQCEVCAVSLHEVEQALCDWIESRPRIVSLEPRTLGDVWADIGRVAAALGVPERGAALVRQLTGRVATVAETAQAQRPRPTVACIEWIEPLMAAGNWMPELVALAGGANLLSAAGAHSPWLGWDELIAADPDVIMVLPCGFDLARTRAEMAALTGHPAWGRLRAVLTGRVALTDGNQYFNRPGPRLVQSLEILAEVFHPGVFAFGHQGTGWQPL